MSTVGRSNGRGGLILALGILSIICCQFLGPVAWVLGSGDSKRINRGEISPEAQGLTQAGMICGIIGTILLILSIIYVVFFGGIAVVGVDQIQPQPMQID